MKHLIFQSRFLILLLGFLTLGISSVFAKEGDVIKEFDCSISGSKQTTYARYTPSCDEINWAFTWGQTAYFGTNKQSNYGNLKIQNTTDLNAAKGVNSGITTSTTGYAAIIPQSAMSNVGKVTISCSELSGSPAVYLVSSSSLSTAYTQVELLTGDNLASQGAEMTATGITFKFSTKASETYYALVFYDSPNTNWYRLKDPHVVFYEGAPAATTLSFNLNNGSGTKPGDITSFPATLPSTDGFTRSGYRPNGWNTKNDGTGTHYDSGASGFTTSESVTLYVDWMPVYTVTYNGNNKTSGSVPVDGNSPYDKNRDVTVLDNTGNLARTGYTWSGWNTNNSGTGTDRAAGSTFTITSNTTLYAKWTANKYNLTFDKNDDEAGGSMDPQEFTFNVAQNLNSNTFTAPAHKHFTGWATTSDGSKAYNNGASYKMTTEGATLYAVWAYNQTTITLDKQEGTGGTNSITATYGQAMPTLSTAPSRNGYEFAGYYSEPNCSSCTKYYNADKSSAATWLSDDATATLYAHWTPKTISVTFNKNGHGEADGSATIVFNTSTWVTSAFVTDPTGYTLNGYYTSSTGGNKVVNENGTLVPNVSNYTSAEGKWIRYSSPTILYAQYTPINYPVKWMVSGEEWTGKGGSTSADYDDKIAAVPTAPETSDCDFMKVFVGWTNNEIDGQTDTKPAVLFTDASNAPTITGETTYYAVFALPDESTTDYAKGTLADLQTGKKVLILSNDEPGDALSSEVGNYDGYLKIEKVTITNGVISNPKNTIIWNVNKTTDKYSFNQGNDKILNMASDGNMYANNTSDTWTIGQYSTTSSYQMKSTIGNKFFDRYNDYGFKGYSSSASSNKVDFYLPATTYSEYATTCVECTNVITISKGEEVEHGSYSLSKTGKVCLSNTPDGTYSVTVTATPDEHYHLATVTTSSGTAGEVVDNTCVVSGITATTTLTAVFEEDPKVAVTWHIGAGSQETAGVYVGTTYSLLLPPSVADDAAGDCATKFMGWVTAAISGSTGVEEGAVAWVTDEYVIDNEHKDIYAVFASKVGEEPSSIEFSLTSISGITTTAAQRTQTTNGITFTFSSVSDVNVSGTHSVQISKNANLTQDKPFVGNISSITFTDFAYSSTSNAAMTITGCSTIDGTYGSVASLDGSYNGADIDFSGKNYKCFKLEVGSERTVKFKTMTVNYMDVSYGNYITQCCTPWTPTLSYAKSEMEVNETQEAINAETNHGTPTYTSSNTNAITVDENTGKITAVGGGTATISVTWTGDDTYCEQSTSSQEITVNGSLQVTFNGNGADGGTEMEAQMVEYGVATNLNKNTYTKTGYTFQGWAETSDATSNKYTDEQSVTFTAGVELFAVWRINAHVVTVQDETGGTIAISPTTNTIDYGTTVTATATLASGYNFVTWIATPAVTFAEATNKSTTFSMPDADITLTASYTPILVTQIDLKKGTDVVTALEFEKNVTAPVTLTTAFTPTDALDKTVEWHSGNTDVVTVVNGVLTAQGLGTAVVTATSTVVPTVAGSVSVTVYEWQDADPKYTLTNQPASTVYYETNKINFSDWTIKHNLKRSDDATKTKQETVASSDWTVTLGGVVIENKYALTTADNGKALVIKVGETTLYNETLTVNEKAKHTFVDRVNGNAEQSFTDTYTIPTPAGVVAACEFAPNNNVFKGWIDSEFESDVITDADLLSASSQTATADKTYYAVWAEHKVEDVDVIVSKGNKTKANFTNSDLSGIMDENIQYATAQGSGTTAPAIYSSCIRLYKPSGSNKTGGKITFSRRTGSNATIKAFYISTTGTSSVDYVAGTDEGSLNSATTAPYEVSKDGLNSSSVTVLNTKSDNMNINYFEITYTISVESDVNYISDCVPTYTLSFDRNNGTGSVPEIIYLPQNGKVQLPNAILANGNNDFYGWNTKADGSGTHYNVGEEYTMGDANTVLYADWKPWTLNSISLDASNATTEFYEDQNFKSKGLKVNASYTGINSGDHEVLNVNGWTTDHDQYLNTPFGHDYEGGVVTVTYQDKTATYNITVTKLLNANFYVWGEYYTTTATDHDGFITMPVIPESDHLVYKDFVGWSKTQFDAQSSEPEMIDYSYMPTEDDETFYAVFGRASNYEEKTMTIDYNSFSPAISSYAWNNWIANENIHGAAFCTKDNSNNMQFSNKGENGRDSSMYNKTMLPGEITSIAINRNSADKAWRAIVSKDMVRTAAKDLGGKDPSTANITWTADEIGTGYRYFRLIETDDDEGAAYVSSFVIKYNEPTIYSWTTNWVEPDQVRTDLVVGNYGTLCVPYAVKAVDRSGATFWNIETSNTPGYTNPSSVTIVEETGDLVAGKPYIFCATDTKMALFFSGEEYKLEDHEDATVPANGLYGNLTDGTITINPTTYEPGYFFVLQQKLYECGVNCTVAPNRGWVQAADIQNMTTPSPAPRRVIGNPNGTPTGINNLNSDGFKNIEGARKYFHNNQIMIVNEGRIYNAQGILIQ